MAKEVKKEKAAKAAEPKAEVQKEAQAAAPQTEDQGNRSTVTLKKEYGEARKNCYQPGIGYRSG